MVEGGVKSMMLEPQSSMRRLKRSVDWIGTSHGLEAGTIGVALTPVGLLDSGDIGLVTATSGMKRCTFIP